MKSICITGANQTDVGRAADILQQAGMKLPRPGKRDDSVDIALWHEQVLASLAEESDEVQPIANPGRFWEQLASDIFVANIKSTTWGWADSRSTWLLDFWLNFEPRLYFVLVCVSPQQVLADAMTADPDAVSSIDDLMGVWQAHHQELLRFHHRNPQRSLLVNAHECAQYPQALIERCVTQWRLPLTAPTAAAPVDTESNALAQYLAQLLAQDYPQTASLQHELAATMTRLGEAEQGEEATALTTAQIIADYRALRSRLVEREQVQAAQRELAALKTRFDEAAASHGQQQQDADNKLKESTQENELLLLQLHQVQEELEAIFLKHESGQKQIDDLRGQLAAQTRARDEQSKLAVERQAQIETLTQANATLTKEKASLAILSKEIESLKSVQTKLKDAEQENELLLLQLHQVQEELEHYFLQHQDIQKQLKHAEERWQRMLQRTPDYCDYESIEVLPAESANGSAITWKIRNLNAAGRSLPELTFKTIAEHGTAGFVFTRQSDGPLMRWPADVANEDELVLIPVGTRETIQQRANALLNLSTSDWDLLQTLTRLLENTLENPASLNAPAGFQPEGLHSSLAKLGEALAKSLQALRYDRVSLKRNQVNPDYEHLWLRLENFAFGGKRWPEFEFRFSCANVRPKQFGAYPKLEFPEQAGQAPFEAWFSESHDDFGAKLELRFSLPESIDLAVWQRLSENDRNLLSALIKRLPAILELMKRSGVQLKRPWDDWINMASEVQRVLALRLSPPTLAQVRPLSPAMPAIGAAPSTQTPQRSRPLQPASAKKSLTKPAKTTTPKPARAPKTRKAQ